MYIKMNEIVNNFLLARYKFIPEIYLKQPWFTYSAYGPFTKKKKEFKNLKKQETAIFTNMNLVGRVFNMI